MLAVARERLPSRPDQPGKPMQVPVHQPVRERTPRKRPAHAVT